MRLRSYESASFDRRSATKLARRSVEFFSYDEVSGGSVKLIMVVDNDDVDTATVTFGGGRPGISPGTSSGISTGGKKHHSRSTTLERGSQPTASVSATMKVPAMMPPAVTQVQMARHFWQPIAIYLFGLATGRINNATMLLCCYAAMLLCYYCTTDGQHRSSGV
jgi:hypothetical protein